MNFNTVLYRLGIDPSNFINEEREPIKSNNVFIYEVRQRDDIRSCPYCRNFDCYIHSYKYIEINCSETDQFKDVLRIKKVRFKCKRCEKTFTPSINGISRYSKISNQVYEMIMNDFFKMITFSDIAKRYGLSTSRIIQIFDEKIKIVPRCSLPFALCIDEIKFCEELNQKYCCVLYDFDKKRIVDIIKNRQMPYLDEYFSRIKEEERNRVKYFISDMYDGYRTVHRKYFKESIHIIDLFHIITQLTVAVNQIRVKSLNALDKDSLEYRFMKSNWRYFLCRKENIPNRYYTSKKTGEVFYIEDIVFRCLLKDNTLLESYNILQDLFHYNQMFFTFNDAYKFISQIANRLVLTGNTILESVGYTYIKWAVEIANGLAKNSTNKHYTNGIAESINNQLKTIIKVSYGYHNFNRFRKRAMLINTYKKDTK